MQRFILLHDKQAHMASSQQSITVDQAREFILAHCCRIPTADTVSLINARHRILVKSITSPVPLPCFTNSAMDGYAFKHAEIAHQSRATLPLFGTSLAGRSLQHTPQMSGMAVRITTGAPVPEWCDTVIPYEKTDFTEKEVSFDVSSIREGANVRRVGENIKVGDVVVEAGTRLESSHLALLASVGIKKVMVSHAPIVSVIITGDELIEPGLPLPRHHVYNTSGVMLTSLLSELGCKVRCSDPIPDDPNRISIELRHACDRSQMIIMTGGAADSMADFSHQQLQSLGEVFNWTVNMRPGRPMRFGRIGQKPVFILPGNPVASFITFLEFVRGAILHMQGHTKNLWPIERLGKAGCDIKKKAGRAEFMRAVITGYENGAAVLEPTSNQSSSSFTSVTQSEAILHLDHEPELIRKGEIVRFQLLSEIL